jgi:hypothetical protein
MNGREPPGILACTIYFQRIRKRLLIHLTCMSHHPHDKRAHAGGPGRLGPTNHNLPSRSGALLHALVSVLHFTAPCGFLCGRRHCRIAGAALLATAYAGDVAKFRNRLSRAGVRGEHGTSAADLAAFRPSSLSISAYPALVAAAACWRHRRGRGRRTPGRGGSFREISARRGACGTLGADRLLRRARRLSDGRALYAGAQRVDRCHDSVSASPRQRRIETDRPRA